MKFLTLGCSLKPIQASMALICLLTIPSVCAAATEPENGAVPPREVTCVMVDRPLVSCLKELSAQSGLDLRVGRGYEDRAITLRVKRMKISDLLKSIAALYGDLWVSRSEKGKPQLVLEASLARRKRQQQLIQQQQEVQLDAIRTRAADLMRNGLIGNDGKPAGADLQLAQEFRARGAVVNALPEEVLRGLLSGGSIRYSVKDTPGQLGVLRTFIREFALSNSAPEVQDRAWIQFSSRSFFSVRAGLQFKIFLSQWGRRSAARLATT